MTAPELIITGLIWFLAVEPPTGSLSNAYACITTGPVSARCVPFDDCEPMADGRLRCNMGPIGALELDVPVCRRVWTHAYYPPGSVPRFVIAPEPVDGEPIGSEVCKTNRVVSTQDGRVVE